ncbi:hypothetical protein [Streptomyces sp. NPDC014006]|uniref:hypothetical protein n=1 Tax=Streptomyces sp. NPDC014006 TaxID=3364870 RepID=UPI0036F595DC
MAAPIEVLVLPAGPGGGGAFIGGVPVAAVEGEEIQRTVLARLHRMALAAGYPVRVTIHDERVGRVIPLQVNLDGSSLLTAEPVPATQRPAPEPGREQPAPGSRQPAPNGGQPAPNRGQPIASAPVRAPHAADAPPAAPSGFDADADADAPPPAPSGFDAVAEAVLADDTGSASPGGLSYFTEPLARISEAVRGGRIEEAAHLADHAASQADRLGPDHPDVMWLGELSAYIAYLSGEPARACHLSLGLARARRRQQDPEAAYGNVQSAATAWRAVRDPRQGLSLGGELIDLWDGLAAGNGPAAEDAEQLRSARARMDRLAARAADGG